MFVIQKISNLIKFYCNLGANQIVAKDFSLRFAAFEMTVAGKVYGEEGNGGKAAVSFLPFFFMR